MHCSTPIAVLFIITAICTTATGTNHKPDSKGSSIEPLDEAVEDSSTNTTALERFRRLIPYMTYYLTQGQQQLQLGQHLLQGGHYNQYNPVNTVPNKLDVTQPRPMSPLVGNGYLLRPLQNFYNPQLQAQQQLQATQPQLQQLQAAQVQLQQLQAAQQQLQIQPQQLVQLKQLQPLGLARFANYRQPQILQNASPLQQSQILHNSAPLQQSQLLQNSAPLQQSQLLQNPTPLQQSQLLQNPAPLQQTQLLQNPTPLQQPHYPRLPSKPFMESDFKPMIKTQQNHQYLPKPQQQYILKAQRPQQVTILQPTQLNYPKTIYATAKPQLYRHQIPQQRPIYLKAYQPQHKALQQYLQEITPVTKIQPVSSSAYSDSQEQKVKSFIDHQVKEYTDQQVKDYSDSDSSVHQISQEQQQQQEKETNNEESQQQEKNTDEEQNSYMHNSQRPSDDEVMTITQSQEIIVPQEPPQQLQQPDQTTLELTELLEGYKLSKTLPETITTSNIGSSIRTLSQILKVLQRANALSALSQPSDDTKIDYEDYANKAALPYSSTQTEASTPGRAGVDYPNYSEIPSTAFNCKDQRYKGFFGDPETNCQVWHYCDLNGGQASFLCPNGTIFSQVALTCDWWFNVKCASTPQLYVLNERLYKYILPQRPSFPEDFAGPLVDQYLTLKYHELEAKKKNATVKATTTKPTSTTETSPPLAPNIDFLTLQSLLTNEVKRRNV